MENNKNEIVKTCSLTKSYGSVCCVNDLNMSVRQGQVYGFLGPNGAGKSTTLKMLLGLVHPTRGEIDLFGKRMNKKSRLEVMRDIGSLIEEPAYYGHLTAEENLRIVARLLELPEENIGRALGIVRLDRQQGKKVSKYSLGMKQRLGIAMALLSFPRLIILDEPTNGLDPAGIQEIRELIRSLPEKYDMTVIVSSHLLSEIDQLADEIGIIANGRMMYQGSLEQLHGLDPEKSLEEIFLSLTREEQSL